MRLDLRLALGLHRSNVTTQLNRNYQQSHNFHLFLEGLHDGHLVGEELQAIHDHRGERQHTHTHLEVEFSDQHLERALALTHRLPILVVDAQVALHLALKRHRCGCATDILNEEGLVGYRRPSQDGHLAIDGEHLVA